MDWEVAFLYSFGKQIYKVVSKINIIIKSLSNLVDVFLSQVQYMD